MAKYIEPETNWHCDKGVYLARLVQFVSDYTRGGKLPEPKYRLIFEIVELSDECESVQVAKNYIPTLDPDGALMQDLVDWLGPEFVEDNITGQDFDLQCLVRREADLRIGNVDNEGYEHPYVWIKAMAPPHSMKRRKQKARYIETPEPPEASSSDECPAQPQPIRNDGYSNN